MSLIQVLIDEALNDLANQLTNASKLLAYREKITPDTYWIIDDDSEDGYMTDYYIMEEYSYLVAKAKRGIPFQMFAVDPKWKPSGGFSDLYSFSGKILKNPKALELFMLEPQTDDQRKVKQSLIDWFKSAKANNMLDIVPYLTEIIKANKDYQMKKRAQV